MKNLFFFLSLVLLMAFGLPEKKISVFMIGDSTMADKPLAGNPERGWGQLFPQFFTNQVAIRNYAVNGRSTKSFLREGRWDAVMKLLQKDDYVIIQFGHNDEKINDTNRYAAPHTLYRTNLIRFVNDAVSKGAHPILVTPVMRRKFDEQGNFVDQHGDYPDVVRALAAEMKIPLIDLHRSSEKLITGQGVEGSKKLFLWIDPKHFAAAPNGRKDDTHFSSYGAAEMASLVCREMKEKQIPLSQYLRHSDFAEKDAFEIPIVYQPHFKKDTFSITDYGAVKDGVTLNTKSIQSAIDDCAKNGGGTVLIPAGFWLTGPIVLASNVEIHAKQGALISFTPDKTQYPLISSFFEGVEAARCQSPISAKNAENIAITGKGIWNGSGNVWRPLKKGKVTDSEWKKLIASGGVLSRDKSYWYSSASALLGAEMNDIGKLAQGKQIKDFEAIHDFLRPNMLQFAGCKNILISGATFENSPAWTLHLLMSDQISVQNVTVKNPWYGQNTDGIDLESSSNVLLDGCSFDTGDDGICIKSGRDAEGRKRGMATENVVVKNCTVYHAHGGFVVGSEMSGSARNLFVSNCIFIGTDVGLRFKTTRGRGGVVENIYASHINMKDIAGEAILFDMYYMAKDPVPLDGEKREMPKIEVLPFNEGTPVFKKFFISDIVCDGAECALFIRGIPESQISQIQLSDLNMKTRYGISCTEANRVDFDRLNLIITETDPVVYIQNSAELRFDHLQYKEGAKLLFGVNGNRSYNIQVTNTALKSAEKKAAFDFGAGSDALLIYK